MGKTIEPIPQLIVTQKHPHGRGEDSRDWKTGISASGNTPTGVGKTIRHILHDVREQKHPHGRGEDCRGCNAGSPISETPPRAWGRLIVNLANPLTAGNTPTGVGKTAHSKFKWLRYYNTFFPFVKELGSVCADFSIISCSPDMDVKSFVGMPFA